MNSPEQPTIYTYYRSQSPQAGQFNSYEWETFIARPRRRHEVSIPSSGSIQFLRHVHQVLSSNKCKSLNPLKRVNSILTGLFFCLLNKKRISLNPLKRVNSILTKREGLKPFPYWSSLNPLKRVNSILTDVVESLMLIVLYVSIPSSGSIQFLQTCYNKDFTK